VDLFDAIITETETDVEFDSRFPCSTFWPR